MIRFMNPLNKLISVTCFSYPRVYRRVFLLWIISFVLHCFNINFLIQFTMSIFSKVASKAPKSSTFNMSYDRKFSMNFGDLVPIHCQEIVPGDKISINPQHMTRLAPMLAPVMHEVNVFIHYFLFLIEYYGIIGKPLLQVVSLV